MKPTRAELFKLTEEFKKDNLFDWVSEEQKVSCVDFAEWLLSKLLKPDDKIGSFIVAEITKNWDKRTEAKNLISQQFEEVIRTNASRGYRLVDWKLNVTPTPNILTETIIAIFEKIT